MNYSFKRPFLRSFYLLIIPAVLIIGASFLHHRWSSDQRSKTTSNLPSQTVVRTPEHNEATNRRYGTGSGSDLVVSRQTPHETPGRYRSLYRTKEGPDDRIKEGRPGEEDEEGEGEARDEWFYSQRAYPALSIPRDARVKMIEALDREETRLNRMRFSSPAVDSMLETAQQLAWASIGPQPIRGGQTFGFPANNVSGRVTAIALDPRYDGLNNKTVYVGGAQGGVWRSTDNGVNWTPLTDGQPSLATGAIAVDPTNPNNIYVGTGEPHRSGDSYYGAGLLKSTDGGATWTQITGPVSTTSPALPSFLNATFHKIEIDPVSPNILFAATNIGATSSSTGGVLTIPIGNRGIWKSTDSGLTWKNVNPSNSDIDRTGNDVLVDPKNHTRVFASILNLGVYRSDAGGEPGTWQRLSGGLPDSDPNSPTFNRIAMTAGPPVSPSTETTLYVAFAAPSNNLFGIYRSTDSGTNWTRVTSPQTRGQTNYNLDIAVDPSDGNTVYYATQANGQNNGGTLFRSRDGGQTWQDISMGDGATGGLHADSHQIVVSALNPNILFTGNDGGIFRTDNARATVVPWTQVNNGLSLTQFTSIAMHPTDPNIMIGGTQDNGTNRYGGTQPWDHIDDGDGGAALIDQSNPQVMYHTYFNQTGFISVTRSTNGGDFWTFIGCSSCSAQPGGFNPTDRVAFYVPMALNTAYTGPNGNVVYLGTNRLYRTENRGTTWTGLGASADGFGADLTKGTGRISAIASHPLINNSTTPPTEITWVGTSDGNVQVTTNASSLTNAVFTNVTQSNLPNRFVTDISLDQVNTQRAVITYSGFNTNTPTTPGHVFVTTNRGASWIDISGNLPDVPVTSVAVSPNSTSTIYIGTDLGVFQTTDGGANWIRLSNGMPRVATFVVRYHAASNSIVAATHGRGIFRLVAANSLATVSAANFSASSVATEAIVAGFGTGLATGTQNAGSVPLPTDLLGTQVKVNDSMGAERLAPLFYVSPLQVNFQIPQGTAAGTANITIISGNGAVSGGQSQIATVTPSLFSANSNGNGVPAGYALRVSSNNVQTQLPINTLSGGTYIPVPIDLGSPTDQTFIIIYGTGFRYRSSLGNVKATIGGVAASVQFAGAQGSLVGLDQCNILIPRSLIGAGEVDLVLIVDNILANKLRVSIK